MLHTAWVIAKGDCNRANDQASPTDIERIAIGQVPGSQAGDLGQVTSPIHPVTALRALETLCIPV